VWVSSDRQGGRVRVKPEAQEWFFFKAGSDAGLKAGPFSWERLLAQAQGGALEPTDVVWDPNSGWKTAAQVPGLFPSVAAPGVTGTFPDTPAKIPFAANRGRSRLYLLSALVALVIVGGGLGAYFGLAGDGGDVVATTSTIPGATTIPVTTTGSTGTSVTVTTSVGGTPLLYLAKKDTGHEEVLHVGDRVRIDLKPWKGDKIKSVEWDYRLGAVREVDSGSETAGSAVVASWLELEAVVAGPATVRAVYHYPDGTARATWVVYLFVEE
jgi:hypothetical protein